MNTDDLTLDRARQLLRANDFVGFRKVCEEHRDLIDQSLVAEKVMWDGRLEAVAVLIELGIFGLSRKVTGLDAASLGKRPDVIRSLLSAGAPVDNLAISLSSPLCPSSLECVQLLVEAGADVDRDALTERMDTPLAAADDPAPNSDRAKFGEIAEYLRSVGATKPWDDTRSDSFWDGSVGQLATQLVEASLGVVAAPPLMVHRTANSQFDVRRARYGFRNYVQALFTAGIGGNGDACEIALATHSLWPTHRGAIKERRFRVPVEFLSEVGQRIIDTSRPVHGDVLDRDHPLVGGIEWPGDFRQWLVKWEKPALKGGKNNLVIPLCYNAPWLSDFKDIL